MTPAFVDLVDLASERLGASVVASNDEFFGEKERVIVGKAPVWMADRYTDRGKWMDGWETRRRREPGHDWCVVRLGAMGVVRGVDVETTFFAGNYPESCAIDVCESEGRRGLSEWDDQPWDEILSQSRLQGDSHNYFDIPRSPRATHLRLRIFPDGGVARLRVYGEVTPDWTRLEHRSEVDLAAVEHGGVVIACSDMFFGHRHNVIMPGDAKTMADGWETRRRRGDGHDWTIVRLGAPGVVARIEVDTRHFKGNAPGACSVDASRQPPVGEEFRADWTELLARTALEPDARHVFDTGVTRVSGVTHVRLNIFPDGGVARLRLFGRRT